MNKGVNFQIDITRDPKVIEHIGMLRSQVWSQMGAKFTDNVPNKDLWLDAIDYNESSINLAVYINGEIVAGARLSQHESVDTIPDAEGFLEFRTLIKYPCISLNRLFVLKDFRHLGIAVALDKKRMEIAETLGAKSKLGVAVGEKRCKNLMDLGFTVLKSTAEDSELIIPGTNFYFMISQP